MASQAIIANQRSAGEGSGVDISQADATPLDVLEGKTFFSALSKELQTGTMTAANLVKFASGTQDSTGTIGNWKTIPISDLGFKPKFVCYSYLNAHGATPVVDTQSQRSGTSGWIAEINGSVYSCCAFANSYDSTMALYGTGWCTITDDGFTAQAYEISTSTKWCFSWYAWGW